MPPGRKTLLALTCCAAFGPAAAFEMDTDLGDAWIQLYLDYDEEGDGTVSIAGAGDVDGDGYDDLLLGAYDADDQRRAYLVLGRDWGDGGSMSLVSADVTLVGETEHASTGYTVSGAGDVDGDGLADILVANPWAWDEQGAHGEVFLLLGRPRDGDFFDEVVSVNDADASFRAEDDGDYAGASLAPAGDFDGDGLDDFLVGAPSSAFGEAGTGRAYLVRGRAGGWAADLADADLVMEGERSGDEAGCSVAGAGDVDGDGYDDLLVGARFAGDGPAQVTGRAYLMLGTPDGTTGRIGLAEADATFDGANGDSHAGTAVAGAGDVNGDGYDDFLVGAPASQDDRVHLLFGRQEGWSGSESLAHADVSIRQWDGSLGFGSALAGIGDVDGDGYDDVLMGDVTSGEAFLLLGRSSGWADGLLEDSVDASFVDESTVGIGAAVAGAGDVDGDGTPDLLIGSTGGRAYVVREEVADPGDDDDDDDSAEPVSEGCDCSTIPGSTSSPAPLAVLSVLLAATAWRRRRGSLDLDPR